LALVLLRSGRAPLAPQKLTGERRLHVLCGMAGAAMGTPLTLFLAGHVKCWMMIATAQVVFFFNCIMFMAGSSFPILFLSRTIGGVGSTFLQSGAIAMLDSLYPSSERGNRFVMIYFCGGFGLTMGPLIGGSLSSDGSFIPCLLAALTLAGVFALVMMFLRDNEAEFTKMEPLAPHVRDQQTLLSLASLVLVSSTVAFSEVILPLHLNVAFATTASALGGLLMIAAIAFIFVANVAALVSEKINRNMMMGAGLACNGVAFLALFSPESLAVEVVPVMLLGCSASVVYTGVFLRMVDSVGQGDARSPALQQVPYPASICSSLLVVACSCPLPLPTPLPIECQPLLRRLRRRSYVAGRQQLAVMLCSARRPLLLA
jgi:predicted MFS family arabinose efflux permease